MSAREIDALVAEHVMGWKILTDAEMLAEAERVWVEQPDCRHFLMGFSWDAVHGVRQDFRPWSRDIAAAWEVVEKLRETWWDVQIEGDMHGDEPFWIVGIEETPREYYSEWLARAEAPTAPLAICLAALKAKGVEP